MEERLKIFINELKDRQCKAEAISSRESNLDGNKMLKNENNGKYIAYSHCIRKLTDILREGQKEQNPTEALHKHDVRHF